MALVQGSKRPLASLAKDRGLAALLHAAARSAADATDPLYRLKKNENLVAFTTDRYVTAPLIIKGAAAGAELAAAGIFADLLRLTTYSEYFA